MITLNTQDKAKLEKALTRATDLTLRATDVDGVYFVYSGPSTYMVVIAKQDGQVKSDCACPAGQHDRICKHQALCLKTYRDMLIARGQITIVAEDDIEGQRWAQEEAEDEAFFEAESKKPGFKCCECEFMRVENDGEMCQLCQETERLDREEFLLTEVLQPRYRRAG